MPTVSEVVRIIDTAGPEAAETALEGYRLRTELAALQVVDDLANVLDRLPLPPALRASPQWAAVLNEPVLKGNKNRIAAIRTRLAELAAPTN